MRALAIVLIAACGKSSPPIDHDQVAKLFDEIVLDVPPGESDLTLDDHGKI
jgi:hypothetical protein